MLYSKNHAKEKCCAGGANIFRIIYLRRNWAKKFWFPPQTDAPPLPVKNDSSLISNIDSHTVCGCTIQCAKKNINRPEGATYFFPVEGGIFFLESLAKRNVSLLKGKKILSLSVR